MPSIDKTGYEFAIYKLRCMASGERWKAQNGDVDIADSFRFRAEVLEQAARELSEEDISSVPMSFVQGLMDVQAGRVSDLDDVLPEKPPSP
jgi:hypothetical protein